MGGQAGAEMTDFLVVLNSRSAINSFMAAGSLTLGGNMSIALGPLGRNGEATGALNTNGKVAAMYSYSKTRGLFGGISIEGSVIVERQDANVQAYNSPVTARLLLGGVVEPPTWATPLIKTLEACTGMPGGREWVYDERPRTPGGTYIFGGVASPGAGPSTPSFLRKKKKSEKDSFPPQSWGTASDSGSYFTDERPGTHSRNMTWDGHATIPSTFETRFESDFSVDQPISSKSNPFANGNSSSSEPKITAKQRHTPYFKSTSLDYASPPYSPPSDIDPFSVPSHTLSYIKPKPELTRPLLPHEGVAKAIALYNFRAVESGDLSFSKGDVIIITQKSGSTDDWWKGKLGSHEGIFPANFVEVV